MASAGDINAAVRKRMKMQRDKLAVQNGKLRVTGVIAGGVAGAAGFGLFRASEKLSSIATERNYQRIISISRGGSGNVRAPSLGFRLGQTLLSGGAKALAIKGVALAGAGAVLAVNSLFSGSASASESKTSISPELKAKIQARIRSIRGMSKEQVKKLQGDLGLKQDGRFGQGSIGALRASMIQEDQMRRAADQKALAAEQRAQATAKAEASAAAARAELARAKAEGERARIAESNRRQAEITRKAAAEKAVADRKANAARVKAETAERAQRAQIKAAQDKRDKELEAQRTKETLAIRAAGVAAGVALGPGVQKLLVERRVNKSFAAKNAALVKAASQITALQSTGGRGAAGKVAGIAAQARSQGLLSFNRGRAAFFAAGGLAISGAISGTLSRTAFADDRLLRTISETSALATTTGAIALTAAELVARSNQVVQLDAVAGGVVRSAAPAAAATNAAAGAAKGWSDAARAAALKARGGSAVAQKAAAAPAAAAAATRVYGARGGLGTVAELRKQAGALGIKNASRMNKDALTAAIKSSQSTVFSRAASAASSLGRAAGGVLRAAANSTAGRIALKAVSVPVAGVVGSSLSALKVLDKTIAVDRAGTLNAEQLARFKFNQAGRLGRNVLSAFTLGLSDLALSQAHKRGLIDDSKTLAQQLGLSKVEGAVENTGLNDGRITGQSNILGRETSTAVDQFWNAGNQGWSDEAREAAAKARAGEAPDAAASFVENAAQKVAAVPSGPEAWGSMPPSERQNAMMTDVAASTNVANLYAQPQTEDQAKQSQYKGLVANFQREASTRLPPAQPTPIPAEPAQQEQSRSTGQRQGWSDAARIRSAAVRKAKASRR